MERFFQITGSNGCGKTSALRRLGESPRFMSTLLQLPEFAEPIARTSAIGFQAGQNVVFSRSVRSLLCVPLVFSGLPIGEANVRLESILGQFNFGYLLNRDYLTLSGGERQFVALFSSMLSDVDLYLLDDPVVMMDQERATKILWVIKEYFAEPGNRRCVIASIRPTDYAGLHITKIVHLGYSPNPYDCLDEFGNLLASLEGITRRRSAVVLEDVTVSPYGPALICRQSHRFQSGELALITGANGAGKTCLLHALAGIVPPRSGSIALLEADQKRETPVAGRNSVYLPQQFLNLVGFDTIFEELGTPTAPKWWRRILEFLYDWRILHPRLRVPESSLGERHFCNILAAVSALARDPAIRALLLDEPDSGLDELRCGLLTRIFHWLAKQNYVVVVVTHRPHLYYKGGVTQAGVRELAVTGQRLLPGKAVA